METLKIARIKNGWTQQDLANVCNATMVTISNLETGKHSPQEQTKRKIEIVLGPIDWTATKDEGLIQSNGHHIKHSSNGGINE